MDSIDEEDDAALNNEQAIHGKVEDDVSDRTVHIIALISHPTLKIKPSIMYIYNLFCMSLPSMMEGKEFMWEVP